MSPPGRLILVRHGQTESNLARRFNSSEEDPLTALGRRQVREAAARILSLAPRANVSRLISSPYLRARESAAIIAAAMSLAAQVEIEALLREQDLGRLAGEPYEAVFKDPAFERERMWLWRAPGGESHSDVRARVTPVLHRIAAANPSGDVVIVSHGWVMKSAWAYFAGWEAVRELRNGEIIVVENLSGRLHSPSFP